jgi:acetylornithine deacetylase/succinyl-diaminopimelate desuccinylase-like protein
VNEGDIPSIILGPDSIALAHQVDECVSIDEMARAVNLYLRTIELWAADQAK